jgi:sulfatase modifying factor 1
MGTNPSKKAGENRPVETVSWYEATVFCNKLSIKEGLTPCYAINGSTNPGSWGECPYEIPNTSKIIGDSARWNNLTCDWTANGYRLPTEAEWEFAAGGGFSHTRYAGTSDKNNLGDYAWIIDNSQKTTHDVAGKLPNSFGIFDMTGNVHEWCWDWYGPYTAEAKVNPKGVKRSSSRTDHGGCWLSYPLPANNVFRVCYRNFRNPGHLTYAIGFRVAQNKQN